MLTDFFFHLRERRLPVSTTEYLALLEALNAGLANYSLEDFHTLARTCLIKTESNYDKFDVAFGEYFQSLGAAAQSNTDGLPEEWIEAANSALLAVNELKLMDTAERDDIDDDTDDLEKRTDHSGKPLGNGGKGPFGQCGLFRKSLRVDGEITGNQRAIKPWDSRQFKGFDEDSELSARNIKIALRRLRKFAREGAQEEFDLDDTIASTARNAGWLDIKMRPERENKVKVLIFFDNGGSMDAYVKLVEELFSAVRSEFKQLEYYYFHNCIYDSVWRSTGASLQSHYPLHYLMNRFGKEYKLIIVGDASMSPLEILKAGEGLRQTSKESGEVWIRRLLDHYKSAIWLNPEPEHLWRLTQSIQILQNIMDERMYPLTVSGIEQAMKRLNK